MSAAPPVAGVLLTGGASTRMGTDKATLRVGGVPMAVRLAGLLRQALGGPLLEVGPGCSGLPAVPDDVPGAGPLAAVATAARWLAEGGWHGPALVLACDLPLLSRAAVDLLARWPGEGAVLPVVGGHRQPLCARWSADDLAAAVRLAAEGQRSLRGLPGASPGAGASMDAEPGAAGATGATGAAGACTLLTEDDLPPTVAAAELTDADSPADLAVIGLEVEGLAGGDLVSATAVSARGARGRGAR